MKIINEDGNEWINLPSDQKGLITVIAVFLKDYFPNKTALLLQPTTPPHTTIDIAKKLNVDIILQDQAHHCVDLPEPTFSNNWEIPFYYLSNNFEDFYKNILSKEVYTDLKQKETNKQLNDQSKVLLFH
jgi:hypothetical protein